MAEIVLAIKVTCPGCGRSFLINPGGDFEFFLGDVIEIGCDFCDTTFTTELQLSPRSVN
jgi:uncharacterized Zn-finger protein